MSSKVSSAERLAHTIKGLAGQMGAGELQHLAQALEQGLVDRPGAAQEAALHRAFSAGLKRQIEAIKGALQANGAKTPTRSAVDPAQVAALMKKLRHLLATDDAKAERLLDENESAFAVALPEHYRELRLAVKEFDFERALAVLAQARAGDPA